MMQPNDLDSSEIIDLMAFRNLVNANPIPPALVLFPDEPEGSVSATVTLGAYAIRKAEAMQCRLGGDIQSALMHELACEELFLQLPPFARW